MVRLCNLTDSSPIFLARVNHVTVLILFHVIVKYLLVAVKIMKKEKRILENFVTLGHDNLNTSVTHVKDIQSRYATCFGSFCIAK